MAASPKEPAMTEAEQERAAIVARKNPPDPDEVIVPRLWLSRPASEQAAVLGLKKPAN